MSALLTFDILRSPLRFLEEALAELPLQETLRAGEAWWLREGKAISDAVDRAGTPWLQMFDRNGTRIDQPLFPPEYGRMLKRSEEHTSELQSQSNLVCRLLLEKKKT